MAKFATITEFSDRKLPNNLPSRVNAIVTDDAVYPGYLRFLACQLILAPLYINRSQVPVRRTFDVQAVSVLVAIVDRFQPFCSPIVQSSVCWTSDSSSDLWELLSRSSRGDLVQRRLCSSPYRFLILRMRHRVKRRSRFQLWRLWIDGNFRNCRSDLGTRMRLRCRLQYAERHGAFAQRPTSSFGNSRHDSLAFGLFVSSDGITRAVDRCC